MLKHHKWKLFFVGMCANLALIASLAVGDAKAPAEINWLDVFSEGGAAVLALVWLGLILHSRPAGRVTQYLSLGLSGIFLAGFQDLLDEFIRFPEAARWDHWIESGCMPIGLVLLTLGIYHWHKEQLSINEQLRKRERLFREHRSLDFTTNLSGADYLRKQLQQALPEHRNVEQSLALLFIDIDNFREINRRYGHHQGDRSLTCNGACVESEFAFLVVGIMCFACCPLLFCGWPRCIFFCVAKKCVEFWPYYFFCNIAVVDSII